MGAWIETQVARGLWAIPSASLPIWERGLKQECWIAAWKIYYVAPYMGAWIETVIVNLMKSADKSRSLYGSVD